MNPLSKLIYHISMIGKQKHTCPYRTGQIGPWLHTENTDHWRKMPNSDRVCSFCGSLHPDDFEKILDRGLTDESVTIEMNDHHDKVYVTRPEIKNAQYGGIKFRTMHIPDKEWLNRVEPKYTDVAKVSRQRMMEQFAKVIDKNKTAM